MIFKPNTVQEERDILASYMPTGAAWDAKNNPESIAYSLTLGLSKELVRFQQRIEEKMNELDINQTQKLLPEWEFSLGLPNNCFTGLGTVANRRAIIIALLARFPGVSTIQEIQEEVINFLEINAVAVTGWDWEQANPGSFPDDKTSKNTLVIDFGETRTVFPIPFPLNFSSSDDIRILRCILLLLLPAYVDLVFKP